ncbi:MAG: PKD domain-containing protein, partial [Halocynthiibacter sp.]
MKYLGYLASLRSAVIISDTYTAKRALAFLAIAVMAMSMSFAAFAEVGTAVRISSDTSRGDAPLRTRFTLLAQTYPSGEIARVEVDPGDGSAVIVAHTGRGWIRQSPRYTYTRPGRFTARMTMVTTDGQRITARTRITVLAAVPADPSELLTVAPAQGDAPHTVTFQIGGRTLPFTARAARLNFGDGQVVAVTALQSITHTYTRPGRYLARLEFRGSNGNRARAARLVTVAEGPRLRFVVVPTSGVAPVEVTVRANVPRGQIRRAGV